MSAYGGSGKRVGYYVHGSQIKREHAVTDKTHRCQPFRIPARKIEERAWTEIVRILEGTHREKLFEALRGLERDSAPRVQSERRGIDLQAVTVKMANLARRIGELPAGVPADAFYAEMKNLAETGAQLRFEIAVLEQRGHAEEIVTETQYAKLFQRLKAAIPDGAEISTDAKRRIIQALIPKVVVTRTGFKMHFYAGVDQIKAGEALASPAGSFV